MNNLASREGASRERTCSVCASPVEELEVRHGSDSHLVHVRMMDTILVIFI